MTDLLFNNQNWQILLTEEERKQVLSNSILLSFGKGETIIKQGFVASHILFLEVGMAKLNVEDGKRNTTIKIITQGAFIGLMCSFVQKHVDFSAVAIVPSQVRLINREVFENIIRCNGKFAVNIVKLMSEMTNSLVYDLISLSHRNVNGSLAILLIDLRRLFDGDSFQIPFTRSEMADALGYSKESVINTLSGFQRNGLIKISGKTINIIHLERLKMIAENG